VKLFILAGVASLSCGALVAACSSSSNHGSGGGGDGGTSGDGAGGDAKTGDCGSSSGGTPYSGTLAAAETTGGVFDIAGSFIATPDASATANTCPGSGTTSGSCCYEPPIVANDAGAVDAGTIAVFSAGTITIKDGTATLANLNPGTNGAYGITSGASNPTVKWTGGDTLAVSAAGATVEAFTGNLVTAVALAGVTPALSLQTATTVPLADPYVVSWTPGTATTVRVTLIVAKGMTEDGSISCSVDDSAGTVSFPTALLSKLTTGDTGIISLTRTSLTTTTGSNATVQLASTTSSTGLVKLQ
jgi:hypothetical protein